MLPNSVRYNNSIFLLNEKFYRYFTYIPLYTSLIIDQNFSFVYSYGFKDGELEIPQVIMNNYVPQRKLTLEYKEKFLTCYLC